MKFPLIGNERLENAVQSFINTNRIPHALLIEGESGTGRHTLAGYITRACICKAQQKPCGSCESCHLADVGSHPDIITVAPESGKKSISVEKIREVRKQAFVKAHIADKRVFVLDRADSMNEQAQNALLKVLEEPPQGVVFILIAVSRTALLDTIVSRCVTLTPAVPEAGQAADYLVQLTSAEKEEAMRVLREASGRIGRALELLQRSDNDKAATAAAEFMQLMEEENEWGILKLLAPFEKDRVATDALFEALKQETVLRIKNSTGYTAKAARLNRFYEQLCGYGELLKTNINLSLLFSAVACNACQHNL